MARSLADVTARTIKQLAQSKWQSSGLTDKHARKLKLRPLDAAEIKRLSARFHEAGGLHIPYFTLAGKPTKFYRIRYLEKLPGAAGIVERPQRYDQLPVMQEAYYPPLMKKSWVVIAKETSIPIFITEGELKAACACANAIPMMALGGVYSFMSSKRGVDLLPSMKEITWKDRLVYVVYDNDLAKNPDVVAAQRRLAERLLAEGAKVAFISIPPGPDKGVDDFIVKHGVKAFYPLVDAAQPFAEGTALWSLNEDVVLVRKIDAVIERKTDLLMYPDQFTRHLYSNRFYMAQTEKGTGKNRHVVMEKAPLAPRWMEWEQRAELWDVTYEPGKEKIHGDSWNMWTGWGAEAKKGPVGQWEWILDFLFANDKTARRYFEQWCAYPIQNPGAKLYTAALLWSRTKGLGKSIVGIALSKIYGENAVTVNARELQSTFNSWAPRRQLVVGEEISAGDKRHDADYLKYIITAPSFRVNEKNKPEYSHENHANFLLFSNHPDAVNIEDGDRRYLVHAIPHHKPAPREKYEWVHRWLHGEGPSYLRHHLERLSLKGFNPREHAPETISKREMIVAGKTDVALWVMKVQEDATFALKHLGQRPAEGCDLFTPDQLYRAFDPDGRARGPSCVANLGRAMAAAGFRQVNGHLPVSTATGLHRLYAVRNQTNWDQATRKEIREHYNSFFGPQAAGAVK